MHTVEVLRELLRRQALSAPYIVVGHSLGGQYTQLFARRHEAEVSALLLVDAPPLGVLKPGAQFPWYTRAALGLFAPDCVSRDLDDADTMGGILLGEPAAFDKPVVRWVAAADRAAAKPKGLLADLLEGAIYAEDFGVWAVDPGVAEKRLDELDPNSVVRHLRAHHRMQEAAPAAVVEAIRERMYAAECTLPNGPGVDWPALQSAQPSNAP